MESQIVSQSSPCCPSTENKPNCKCPEGWTCTITKTEPSKVGKPYAKCGGSVKQLCNRKVDTSGAKVFCECAEGWSCVVSKTDGPEAGKTYFECGEVKIIRRNRRTNRRANLQLISKATPTLNQFFFLPMAAPNLLHFATTTNSNLNFQIPTINIKHDRSNFHTVRTTIISISALETFDLQEHVLNPNPPPTTIDVPAVEAVPATDTTPAVAAVPATTAVNPDYTTWKKRDRFTLTKGSMSMIEYLEKKRSISDSLAATLHPIPDEDLISYILNGLDVSYGPFITAFMMKTESLTIDDLTGFLLQEEARLEQEHLRLTLPQQSSTTALNVHRSNPRHQNPQASNSSNNYRNYNQKKSRPTCQLCSKLGHEAIDCWQRGNQVDFPSRKPNPRNNQRQAHLAHQPNPSTTIDPAWYFDTGATDHVTPDITKLNIAEPYNGDDKLQVGNGNHLNISHVGSSVLPNLKLPNVLLVPDLTKSLLSVPKLTEDNNVSMEFFPKTCSVKTLQGQTILRGDKHHGLYLCEPLNTFVSLPSAIHSKTRISLHGGIGVLAHPH
ncbi:retrovirus-related pol polyprotein from transposon TNT 1-94 [Tanacetum coccineum]